MENKPTDDFISLTPDSLYTTNNEITCPTSCNKNSTGNSNNPKTANIRFKSIRRKLLSKLQNSKAQGFAISMPIIIGTPMMVVASKTFFKWYTSDLKENMYYYTSIFCFSIGILAILIGHIILFINDYKLPRDIK